MVVFTYEFGSEDLEWKNKTKFRKDELSNLNNAVETLHSVLSKIETQITEKEQMRLCTVKLYNPHKVGDTILILTVPRAKIYHETNSENVTEKVRDFLDKRENVTVCTSEEEMKESFEEHF